MITTSALHWVNPFGQLHLGQPRDSSSRTNDRSVHGDNVDNEVNEADRAPQRKTFFGTIIGGVVNAARKLVDGFCRLVGLESPIDKLHRRLMIAPNRHTECTPCELRIPHERVEIRNGDVTLRGHFLRSPVETKKTIIFLNGRGHNASHCFRTLAELQRRVPVNVLMVDYRGCGNSTGTATFPGLVSDAEAMYDYLVRERGLSANDISVFGVSLGGGVAVQLARRREINTLVVQSSFTSIEDVASNMMSRVLPDVLVNAAAPLVRTELNSEEAIKEAKAKNVLILHGTQDEIVPYRQGVMLYRRAREAGLKPVFIRLKGAGHCNFADFYDDDCIKLFRRLFGVEENNNRSELEINRVLARVA